MITFPITISRDGVSERVFVTAAMRLKDILSSYYEKYLIKNESKKIFINRKLFTGDPQMLVMESGDEVRLED